MEVDASLVAKREPTHYSLLDIKNMKVKYAFTKMP
jgi:hypothetical protein